MIFVFQFQGGDIFSDSWGVTAAYPSQLLSWDLVQKWQKWLTHTLTSIFVRTFKPSLTCDTFLTTSPLTIRPWTNDLAVTNARITFTFMSRGMSPNGLSVSCCLATHSRKSSDRLTCETEVTAKMEVCIFQIKRVQINHVLKRDHKRGNKFMWCFWIWNSLSNCGKFLMIHVKLKYHSSSQLPN